MQTVSSLCSAQPDKTLGLSSALAVSRASVTGNPVVVFSRGGRGYSSHQLPGGPDLTMLFTMLQNAITIFPVPYKDSCYVEDTPVFAEDTLERFFFFFAWGYFVV